MRAFPESSRWLLTLSAVCLCSCFAPFEVECGVDAHCNRFPGGLCHTNPQTDRRWCSYPDPACPHGYRYSDLDVGDGDSAACTGESPARCDPTAELEPPTLVANLNSSLDEYRFSMTSDELTAVLLRVGGPLITFLTSTRSSITEDFAAPIADPKLGPVLAEEGIEFDPLISPDGLSLYFERNAQLFVSVRAALNDVFLAGTAVTLDGAPLSNALLPHISADGQTLYWLTDAMLHSAKRASSANLFQRSLVSTVRMTIAILSPDELTVYYLSGTPGDPGIYNSTRASKEIPFGAGTPIAGINSAEDDWPAFMSGDGCLLYIASRRTGSRDIWVARRPR